jgi:hypothetical protein
MPILRFCLHVKQMTTILYVILSVGPLFHQLKTMHGSGFDVVGHRISGEPLIVLASRFGSIQVLRYSRFNDSCSVLNSLYVLKPI